MQRCSRIESGDRFYVKFVFFCLAVVFFALFFLEPILTNDFWFHAKVGESIHLLHQIPSTIEYAYGPIKHAPFIAHSWLSCWWFYLGMMHFGYYGMSLIKWLLFGVVIAQVAYFVRLQSKDWVLLHMICFCALLGMSTRAILRPELLGIICFIGVLSALCFFLQTGRWRHFFWALFLQCLWVNLHPSYWIGLYLPMLFGMHDGLSQSKSKVTTSLGSTALPWGIAILSFWVISMVNPYGLSLHVHTLRSILFEPEIHRYALEWKPFFVKFSFASVGWIIRLVLFSVLGYFLWLYRRCMPLWGWGICLPLGVMAVVSQRFMPFFVLSALLPLSLVIAPIRDKITAKFTYQVSAGLLATLLIYSVCQTLLTHDRWVLGFRYKGDFSQEAIDFMQQHAFEGRVWNRPALGGQLVYFFYPSMQVSMDGRLDAYGGPYLRSVKLFFARPWPEVREDFKRDNIRYLMFHPQDITDFKTWRVYDNMRLDHWCPVFSDSAVVIFMQEASCPNG